MRVHRFKTEQRLDTDLATAWNFFTDPANLNDITPTDMNFNILSDVSHRDTYAGLLIVYKVSPFPFFTTNWVTEITAMEHQHYFIDEQRFGPFKLWHHRHVFKAENGGVLMTDELHYCLPFGWLGELFHPIIGGRVRRIFEFRREKINQIFKPLKKGN